MAINDMRGFRSPPISAFTLLELLVSIVVLLMIMSVIFEITSDTGLLWKRTTARTQSFQGARSGFESMSRNIRQATLNTYYDYFDASGYSPASVNYSGTPAKYGRQSELHFISGPGLLASPAQVTHAIFFQAPLGYTSTGSYSELNNTLNALGYYVVYNSDAQAGTRPSFLPASFPLKYRYRLMQFTQACENLSIYQAANTTGTGWFTLPIRTTSATTTHLLAENIIALIILPKESVEDDPTGTDLSPAYIYDSRTPWSGGPQPLQTNQLPPVVHVAMVALDETSAQRICTSAVAPDVGISGLFADASKLNVDLAALEQNLDNKKLNYRLFETDIAIRGAKWSN